MLDKWIWKMAWRDSRGSRKRLLLFLSSMVIGVAILVGMLRLVAQPWRGIIDAGVVVGLSWGTIATLACYLKVADGKPVPWAAETPINQINGGQTTFKRGE